MKDYKTITYRKKVGCGHIYVIFMEDDNAFHKVLIRGDMAKQSPCGDAWFDLTGRLLTYALRRGLWEGTTEIGILKQFRGTSCFNVVPNKDHTKGCIDAIGRCLTEYLESRNELHKKIGCKNVLPLSGSAVLS